MRWITDNLFAAIVGWISAEYAIHEIRKPDNQQPYEHGLYGRIRYWLHGIFHTLEKKEVRLFRKPSKWRWGK